MDEFIGKLSLYDYLVRLIAGGITILGAYYSDLVGAFWNLKNISAIAFILCSYGVGIVLEEISYIWKNVKGNCFRITEKKYQMNL